MSKRVRLFPCVVMVALCLVVPAVASAVPSLWASDGIATDLFELDALTGAVLSTISGPGVFRDALSFDTDGQSIWILDSSNNSTVFYIDLTGAILTSFFVPLDAEGLTILADGSLIVGGGTSGLVANIGPHVGRDSLVVRSELEPVWPCVEWHGPVIRPYHQRCDRNL